jgi:hypothetical protein
VAEQSDLNERHAYHPQVRPQSQPQTRFEAPTIRQTHGVLASDFAYTERTRQQRQMTQQQRQLQEKMQLHTQREAQGMAQRQREADLVAHQNQQQKQKQQQSTLQTVGQRGSETAQFASNGQAEQQPQAIDGEPTTADGSAMENHTQGHVHTRAHTAIGHPNTSTSAEAAEAWQRYAAEVGRLRNGSDGSWGLVG